MTNADIEPSNDFPPTDPCKKSEPINTQAFGCYVQNEPCDVTEYSPLDIHYGDQSFANLHTLPLDNYQQSEPSFLYRQNISNRHKDFDYPFDAALVNCHTQDELRGFVDQGLALTTSGSQGPNGWFNSPSINYYERSEQPIIDGQDISAPTIPVNAVAESISKARYLCNWPGCDSAFSRTADRDRHVRTIHGNARRYYCSQPGCNKGALFWKGYTRVDKLQEHMRKKHPGVSFRGTM